MTATTQGRRKYFLPGTEVLTYLLAEVLLSRAESSRRKYFLPSGGTFLLPPGIGAFAGNDDYHNPHDGNVPKVAGSTSFHPLAGSTSARKYAEVLTYLLAEVLPSRAESSRRKYFLPSGGTYFLPPGIAEKYFCRGSTTYLLLPAPAVKYFLPSARRSPPEVLTSAHHCLRPPAGSTYFLKYLQLYLELLLYLKYFQPGSTSSPEVLPTSPKLACWCVTRTLPSSTELTLSVPSTERERRREP